MSRHYKPADLTPHPILARIVPPLGEHEREALFASLDAEGQLTPVLVSNRDGKLYVLDGLNRIAWASDRQDDRGNVRAVAGTVLEGLTEEREVEIGLSVNGGRRHLTAEQRREMVRATLREYPGWSDRKIASACGVSAPMVGDHRKQLVATGEVKESYTRTGRDGVTQPARKPRATGRRKDKPAGNEGAMRAAREAAYVDHDPTLHELGSDADDETKPDAPEPAPSPSQPHETEKEPDAAAPIAANLRRHYARPVDERIRTLIAAAHDMRGISDDELSALQTNDLMVEGLRLAVAQIGRIINLHDERGKKHANHRPSLAG